MAISRGFRIGAIALFAALAAVLALVLIDDSSGDAAAVATGKRTPGRQMLLRPRDLGKGYYFQDFNEGEPVPKLTCGRLHPASPTPALADWLDSDKPAGCVTLYGHNGSKRFRMVGTGALDAGSETAAREGLALALDVIGAGLGESGMGEPVEVEAPGTVGDETRLIVWREDGIFTGAGGGALVAWRSGEVLAAVFYEGWAPKGDERAAFALAKRQQRKRVEHPSPFNPGLTDEP